MQCVGWGHVTCYNIANNNVWGGGHVTCYNITNNNVWGGGHVTCCNITNNNVWAEYSETLKKVSVSTTLAQSRQVSVSTTPKFLVSGSLGLDNSKIPGLKESRSRQLQNSWSQRVSVSTTNEFQVSASE